MLDGEVADSTRTEAFAKEYPDRFFECYIAEQQMVGAALGLQAPRLDAGRRDVRARSSPGRTTSSGWPPSAGPT